MTPTNSHSMDAKFGFDDNADFRQKDIFALRDTTQEDPQEMEAAQVGTSFSFRSRRGSSKNVEKLIPLSLARSLTVRPQLYQAGR